MRKSLLITLEFPPQRGGTQSYYFNICRNLPGEKIFVLAPKPSPNPSAGGEIVEPSPNPSAGGETETLPLRHPSRLAKADSLRKGEIEFKIYRKNLLSSFLYPHWLPMVWNLRKIIKKEKIELVQAGQVLPCGTAAFLVNKFFNIPYIVYTHGLDILGPQKSLRKKKLMVKILRNAEKVISNSEFTKNEVVKLGIDKERVFVVYPSVDLVDQQNPPPPPAGGPSVGGGLNPPNPPLRKGGDDAPAPCEVDNLRKKYNLDDKKILLSVCRLVERKGVDLVISVLAKFSEELKDMVYVVIGDGPKMEDLKKIPIGCPQVVFAGRVSDEELDLWYRACDVFILTPKKSEFDVEGFGIVYAEAGSYSKPVIGSKLAGTCEAVKDGVTGILVEPDNVEQIGKAIVGLFNDEELREKLGRQGRERVEGEFGVEKMMERLREAIE
ncbi:MAG: glycosyltransferase family 4 protein [bacterium]